MDTNLVKTDSGWIAVLKQFQGGLRAASKGFQNGFRTGSKTVLKRFLGKDYDPLQYVSMSDTQLAGQAGLLADEAAAMPMFGDEKIIVVTGGGGNLE